MSKAFLDVVDKHLARWKDIGLNKLPMRFIEPEMADGNANSGEWKTWKPIDSKVTNEEIDDLEKEVGFSFPKSYRQFLKHKHFYELHIGEASFCRHEVNSWRSSQMDSVFRSYPRQFLIDKGYIPFSEWSDWGALCFDANKIQADNEYPILLWDHERWDEYTSVASDFESLLLKLDADTNSL